MPIGLEKKINDIETLIKDARNVLNSFHNIFQHEPTPPDERSGNENTESEFTVQETGNCDHSKT